jgi:hypothetical protein
MFRRYASGEDSIHSLTQWLNENGVEPPGNGKRRALQWYESTVQKILSNETLTGTVVYGRICKIKSRTTGKMLNRKGDPARIIRTESAFPAIIDKETFQRVRERLAKNERTRPSAGNPGNTLRGLGKCTCGWHVAHQKNSTTGAWYYMCGRSKCEGVKNVPQTCRGTIQGSYVDQAVLAFVRRFVASKSEDIRAAVESYNLAAKTGIGLSATAILDGSIARLQGELANMLAALKKRFSNTIADAIAETEMTLTDLRRKREEVTSAIQVPSVDEKAVASAKEGLRLTILTEDMGAIKKALPAILSGVSVDFRFRNRRGLTTTQALLTDHPLRFEGRLLETSLQDGPLDSVADLAEVAARVPGARMEGRTLVSDQRLEREDFISSPLTFVTRWDLAVIEQASKEAVEALSRILG